MGTRRVSALEESLKAGLAGSLDLLRERCISIVVLLRDLSQHVSTKPSRTWFSLEGARVSVGQRQERSMTLGLEGFTP